MPRLAITPCEADDAIGGEHEVGADPADVALGPARSASPRMQQPGHDVQPVPARSSGPRPRRRRPRPRRSPALAMYHQCGWRSRMSSSLSCSAGRDWPWPEGASAGRGAGSGTGRRVTVLTPWLGWPGGRATRMLDGLNEAQRTGGHVPDDAAVHPRRRRLGQDPGAHPPHRLPRPRPATHDPRRVLALTFTRKAAGELRQPAPRRSACATGRTPARSTPWPTPSCASGGPSAASRPPELLDRKVGFVGPPRSSVGAIARRRPRRRRRDRVGQGPR